MIFDIMDNMYDHLDERPARPRQDIPAADQELLELAARAIGAMWVEVIDGENWVSLHMGETETLHHWNPLVHGDDALDLAIALGLQLFPAARTISGQACVAVASPTGARLAEEASASDAHTATRRAITRAAAEIGKAMR